MNTPIPYVAGSFPKRCAVCRVEISEKEWRELHLLGWQGTLDLQLELRNHSCHTTLAVEVDHQRPHDPEWDELGEAALA